MLGASCSGVSTLGARLSEHLVVPLLDVDGFYWIPTDPPFTIKRPPEDRVSLIEMRQAETPGWVLAASLVGWGNALVASPISRLHLHAHSCAHEAPRQAENAAARISDPVGRGHARGPPGVPGLGCQLRCAYDGQSASGHLLFETYRLYRLTNGTSSCLIVKHKP